jgi:hypothetical protein
VNFLSIVVAAGFLAGCQAASQFAGEGEVLVSKPGAVAVDVANRRAELALAGKLKDFCPAYSYPVPVLKNVAAPDGYGLDERYNAVSLALRTNGAGCLAGDDRSCRSIQEGAVAWATQSSLGKPQRNNNSALFWNNTLTVNMRLINPLISALAVAEVHTPMSRSDRTLVDLWLQKTIENFEHNLLAEGYYKGGIAGTTARKAAHNHATQSSWSEMSYGAWIGNDEAFSSGLRQWNLTLESMREDGSLPIETRRGARALYYHGNTLSALIQIAERAKVQGIDLYKRPPSPEKSLHRAVTFFISAVRKPDLVLEYARTNFWPGPSKDFTKQHLSPNSLAWIAPYLARHPDHPNTRDLRSLKVSDSYLSSQVADAVNKNGESAEWIGVNAKCFYALP